MSTFRVDIETISPAYVCVDIESTTDPTDEQIEAALEALAQEVTPDGYLAEFVVSHDWRVTNIERYG